MLVHQRVTGLLSQLGVPETGCAESTMSWGDQSDQSENLSNKHLDKMKPCKSAMMSMEYCYYGHNMLHHL